MYCGPQTDGNTPTILGGSAQHEAISAAGAAMLLSALLQMEETDQEIM